MWFTDYIVPYCDNCLKDRSPEKEFVSVVDLLNEVFGTNLIVSADPDTVQEQGEDDASNKDNNSTSFMDDATAREINNADEDSDNGADCRGGASVNPADPKKPGPHRAQRLTDC